MSPGSLKAGDRVRVTERCRMYGYQAGDKGTVLRELATVAGGTSYYQVAMDKDGPAGAVAVFAADEIEPDV
jgi:hypothetical protein